MNFISASAYIAAVGLIKVSLLILYLRTFTTKGAFRITLWTVLVLVVLGHGQVIVLYWVKLDPNNTCQWKYSSLDFTLWKAMCHERFSDLENWVFIAGFTVLLDIVVLVLPIRAIWKLQMAKRQKIAISMLMGAGAM